MPSANTISDVRMHLQKDGWVHLRSAGEKQFTELASELGEVMHETEVVVKPTSRGLVTSQKPLDFHTDHSKADYICWLCITPDPKGGETILMKAERAYSLLDARTQATLYNVMLTEHCMFENDLRQFPLVSIKNGRLKFYYSFWLADKNMTCTQQRAFDDFRRAIAKTPFCEFKLQKDDVLVIDNSCILHGRREIQSSNRQLRRFWIKSS